MDTKSDSFKRVTDMTFIIGPPGPTEDKQKFEQWSTNSGKPAMEIWVEYVHDVVSQLASRKAPDSVSDLDELISRAVGKPVRIEEPFLTFTFSGGEKSPVIMLYMDKIFSPNGKSPAIDWSEPALRQLIGSIFGRFLRLNGFEHSWHMLEQSKWQIASNLGNRNSFIADITKLAKEMTKRDPPFQLPSLVPPCQWRL